MLNRPTLKPLSEQAIVVTGATSGIGLAVARRAARAGACVFLIARSEQDLRALCDDLQAGGARVAWAVADVTDHDALVEAAEKCRRLFGGFDTWVNNAGMSIYGPIRETALQDQRQLFETNYWGLVNGSIVAADHLRGRASGGTIINVGSILSDAPAPVQGIYAASKHAVKGFTNALRMELIREGAPINVSLVKPAAVDTPHSRHPRTLTGQAAQNPQPVYATHVVADTILYCASHSIREITVGGGGRLIASFYAAFPRMAEPMLARFAPVLMRDRSSAYQPYDDGLYDPTEDGLDEEVHYPMVRQFSALAEIRKHPGIAGGVVAILAGVGLAVLLLGQRTGPTRYETVRRRLDPRQWIDTEALRHGVGELGESLRGGLAEAGERAGRYGEGAGRWFDTRTRSSGARLKRHGKQARHQAEQAGRFAQEHAREGGALLALVTIATAVGAAVLESRRPENRVRRPAKF
ncbi:SDR family NAD(P)-dependent oxidoreductase [Rhizobium sp. CRIBSB]|nr:SDR family NAD(P)-dependent oxidoreductase [Rhizobium sp. CRIBSB]